MIRKPLLMNKTKISNLWALLTELIESKFTGKVILEINFSQGGITKVYEYKRKELLVNAPPPKGRGLFAIIE